MMFDNGTPNMHSVGRGNHSNEGQVKEANGKGGETHYRAE